MVYAPEPGGDLEQHAGDGAGERGRAAAGTRSTGGQRRRAKEVRQGSERFPRLADCH